MLMKPHKSDRLLQRQVVTLPAAPLHRGRVTIGQMHMINIHHLHSISAFLRRAPSRQLHNNPNILQLLSLFFKTGRI